MTKGFGFCDHAHRDYIENRAGEIIAWSCRSCPARGTTEPMEVRPPSPPPRRGRPPDWKPTQRTTCAWCGVTIDVRKRRATTNTQMRWVYRRFCGYHCYEYDLHDRRATGRVLEDRDPFLRGRNITADS